MVKETDFQFAKPRDVKPARFQPPKRVRLPWVSLGVLGVIIVGCMCADLLAPGDPGYMELSMANAGPTWGMPFGADPLGRNLFSMIWHGGQVSLLVGTAGALVSAVLALVYGGIAGFAPRRIGDGLLWFSDLLLCVPSILLVVFLQGIARRTTPLSIALVIGLSNWMVMARITYAQVRQLREAEYVLAARTMGAGFPYLFTRHMLPELLSGTLFMMVSNVGTSIASEATLSFLGLGLPLDTISWGTMLSIADRAFLSGNWRVVVIPGVFLVTVILCIMELGNELQRKGFRKCGNL